MYYTNKANCTYTEIFSTVVFRCYFLEYISPIRSMDTCIICLVSSFYSFFGHDLDHLVSHILVPCLKVYGTSFEYYSLSINVRELAFLRRICRFQWGLIEEQTIKRKNEKGKSNDLPNTSMKTKDYTTRTHRKNGG